MNYTNTSTNWSQLRSHIYNYNPKQCPKRAVSDLARRRYICSPSLPGRPFPSANPSLQTQLHPHPRPHSLPPSVLRSVHRTPPFQQVRPPRLPLQRLRHQISIHTLIRQAAKSASEQTERDITSTAAVVSPKEYQEDDCAIGEAVLLARSAGEYGTVRIPMPLLWRDPYGHFESLVLVWAKGEQIG